MSTSPGSFPELDALDFEVDSLDCEVASQPWMHEATWLGIKIPQPFHKVPVKGKCPNKAKLMVNWRACPCIANINDWMRENPNLVETHMPVVVFGLAVTRLPMCDDHIEYFVNYLSYPLICSSCGVGFASPREVLIGGSDMKQED